MPRKSDRVAVRATNHATGETWAIHDARSVCETELEAKLKEWGDDPIDVEWDELVDGRDSSRGVSAIAKDEEPA